MADSSEIAFDPDGPVVVMADVSLSVVRAALGGSRWIARPEGVTRWAAAVAAAPASLPPLPANVPVFVNADEVVLAEQLRAFDDGALISSREAEALAWIAAIRTEEERNHLDARRHADERVEVLQERVDELTARALALDAHIAGIEESRAWAIARRITGARAAIRSLPRRVLRRHR